MIVEEVDRVSVVSIVGAGLVSSQIDRSAPVIVSDDRAEVVNVVNASAVQAVTEKPHIYAAGGNQGPQGIQGVPGGTAGQILQATAGEVLGGHRAIFIDGGSAHYAEPAQPSASRVAGITLGAAAENDLIDYQTAGEIVEPSWSLVDGPVYLGPAGTLTQASPASGVCVEIGVAISATTIIVRIGPPILLQ